MHPQVGAPFLRRRAPILRATAGTPELTRCTVGGLDGTHTLGRYRPLPAWAGGFLSSPRLLLGRWCWLLHV